MTISLNPYQFSFNGLPIGAGTVYTVTNVDGLAGMSPLRVQDDIRGYTDGSYSGRDFYDSRTVTIDMVILGDSTYNAQHYYNTLQSKFYPQQLGTPSALTPFYFKITSEAGIKVMYGRVRNITTAIDPEFTFGYIETSVEFYFPDPRYYTYPYQTNSTPSSSVTLTNAGWATSCPVITVASAPSSFTISDGTYSMSFSPTYGDTVVIDLLQRTITQQGIANRGILGSMTGWLTLPPGGATFTISAGSMTISYTDAYV